MSGPMGGFAESSFSDVSNKGLLESINEGDDVFEVGEGGSIIACPFIKAGVVYFGCNDHYLYAVDAESGRELWKFRAEDLVYSPIVYENRIFVGSTDRHLYCLTLDGKLVWKFRTDGVVRSRPAAINGVVYFGSMDHHVYALDMSGNLIWKFRTDDCIDLDTTVDEKRVYIGSWDFVFYAINHDGGLAWKFKTQGLAYSGTISGEYIYFGSFDHYVYKLERESGKLVWKFEMRGAKTWKGITISDGVLYFGSRDKNLYAVTENGELVWKFRTHEMVHCTPLVKGDSVYFGSCDEIFYSVDRETGKLNWKFRTRGAIISSVVSTDGAIIFGSLDCNLYSLTTEGELKWKFLTSSSSQGNVKIVESATSRDDSKKFDIMEQESVRPEVRTEEHEPDRYGDSKSRYGVDEVEEDGLSSYARKKKYR